MSDPDTTRPFSPAELDAIEDALEQLHGNDAFVVGGLPADADVAVRERLASYRAISRLSRDVLHAYEAPRHVLDRVVSLARESAVATAPAPEAAPAPARPSWWTRIRGAWTIPIVATVAAAALVVIVAVPMASREAPTASEGVARNENAPASPSVSTVASSDAKGSDASGTVPAAEGRLAMAEPMPEQEESELRGAALDELSKQQLDLEQNAARADGDTRTSDDATLQRDRKTATKSERPEDSGTAAGPRATPAKPSSKPKSTTLDVPTPKAPSTGKPGGGASPPPEPAEKKDADKGSDALTKADALRRGGDCGSAVKLYESVRKTGTKSQRAKALAGLALCAEREGDRARADELLAKARADDADIDAYYDSER